MPRHPRIQPDGVPLHIVQRGHNLEPCFFSEEDYASYLHWPGEALGDTECQLHAYALMTNHVHLLLTPQKAAAVPKLIMSLGRRFVIEKSNELLSAKNIDEIKEFIGSAAAVFGRTLGDVTHKFTDVVSDTFDVVKKKSGKAMGKTIDIASDAYRTVSETAEKATDGIRGKLEKNSPKLLKAKDPQQEDPTN